MLVSRPRKRSLVSISPIYKAPRPKPAPADFDRDGRIDLMIGDTYGRVRLFRNEGRDTKGRHIFSTPRLIHQSPSRLSLHAGDWNGDRRPTSSSSLASG